MKTTRLTAMALLVLLLGACILPSDERESNGLGTTPADNWPPGITVQEAYDWYLIHGEDPCDPPPDPWHPFVTDGYCTLDDSGK